MMTDLAKRFEENPILSPARPSPERRGHGDHLPAESGRLPVRGQDLAARPRGGASAQTPGKTSFPILSPDGRLEILEFNSSDPRLDLSDPRVISF